MESFDEVETGNPITEKTPNWRCAMSRHSNWSESEMAVLKLYLANTDGATARGAFAEVQKVNAQREYKNVRPQFAKMRRLYGFVPAGIRKEISEAWVAANAPHMIAYDLEKSEFKIGLRRLIEVVKEKMLIPEDAPWESFVKPEKTCSKCDQKKPAKEFYVDPASIDGLGLWCRACSISSVLRARKARLGSVIKQKDIEPV
jgi:hypothetical protein